jgi:hypothetical protein
MFMFDRGALMTPPPPPEDLPGQHAYTFVIRILSTSLTSVSIFFCLLLLQVSISMVFTSQAEAADTLMSTHRE